MTRGVINVYVVVEDHPPRNSKKLVVGEFKKKMAPLFIFILPLGTL
jgi:hypothetical protein